MQKFSPDDPQPVGKRKPNPWGLYDMCGNVGEYVLDGWCDNYEQYAGKTVSDPWRKHADESHAIVRGGDADGEPTKLRSASRRKMRQTQELATNVEVFSSSNEDRIWRTGFRIISPLQYENDGRESRIPPPKYPKF